MILHLKFQLYRLSPLRRNRVGIEPRPLLIHGAAGRGRVIERRSDASLREPSAIARVRDYYLIVNADFSSSVTPFTVTGLPRHYGDDEE